VLSAFLAERGLELSTTKTRITHVRQGFDFLGFHLQKRNATNRKNLRKKSNSRITVHASLKGKVKLKEKIASIIRIGVKMKDIISKLNPILRGMSPT
jgi:RNA-directed DNA polymerase